MTTIPDDVRRLWDSVLCEREADDYRMEQSIPGLSDVADLIDDALFSDYDPDWDDVPVSDNWHDDPSIEASLEGCAFDEFYCE